MTFNQSRAVTHLALEMSELRLSASNYVEVEDSSDMFLDLLDFIAWRKLRSKKLIERDKSLELCRNLVEEERRSGSTS